IKAMVKVNTEMLNFYWELGKDIIEKQNSTSWGDGVIKQLSKDLIKEFPNIRGFSVSNIKFMRQWFLFFSQGITIGQQAVAQLENPIAKQLVTQIPWGHNIAIITKD
ncbi:MAG: DUF1016 domain-containing protein, partial [Candidatus Delongbacteria bacterium]|nr:DUF1016 domain-containing protein [Candidatus Delongbacteria bacterium]